MAHPTHHDWLRPDVLKSPRVRSHYESLLAVMCLQPVNELTSNEKIPSSFLWFAPLTIKITTILYPVLCDVTKALKLIQS